jgi:hypothetical protein
MILQKLLDEFGVMKALGRITAPLMLALGLPSTAGYVWITVNLAGLAYGSGALIEEAQSGALSRADTDLFNHHAALSHSQVEDTLLFVALGLPYVWVALPRFLFAVLVVWGERLRRFLIQRSFRVEIVSSP